MYARRNGTEMVFVEVKTRTSTKYGEAREAVNAQKLNHIINSAEYYLYKNNMETAQIRIDVIEVYIKKDIKIINHIKQVI